MSLSAFSATVTGPEAPEERTVTPMGSPCFGVLPLRMATSAAALMVALPQNSPPAIRSSISQEESDGAETKPTCSTDGSTFMRAAATEG